MARHVADRPGGRRTRRAVVLVLGLGASTLALSGVAHAYWSTQGTGSGTATSGNALMTLSTSDAPSGLYPGGPASTVTVKLTDNGVGTVTVTGLTPSASTAKSGCNAATALTLSRLDALPTALTTAAPVNVRYSVAMAVDADLGCIGATFTLTFTGTGTVG